jgi:hypothetical protein
MIASVTNKKNNPSMRTTGRGNKAHNTSVLQEILSFQKSPENYVPSILSIVRPVADQQVADQQAVDKKVADHPPAADQRHCYSRYSI